MQNDPSPASEIARIDQMPEQKIEDIMAKKKAFNDFLFEFEGRINMVSADSESGSNSPDDESQEEAQDVQTLDLIANFMDHARTEMVRLGGKAQLELKKAA